MTSILTSTALRVAAAALARAGAGSALAAIVLLVLASGVRAEVSARALAGWVAHDEVSAARPDPTAAARARQHAATTGRSADVRFLCRPVAAPCLLVLRGSLPPVRGP